MRRSSRVWQGKLRMGSMAAAVALAAAAVGAAADGRARNVVFILADDLGWSDTTLYGTTQLYETPNIERLAARGMTFTRAYAASPLCSPTRASILTGRNPARLGLTNPNCHLPDINLRARPASNAAPGNKATDLRGVSRLDTKYPTLGKQVRAAGYATAHFGKWHLGAPPYSPLEHGFDIDIPHWPGPGPGRSYLAPWSFETLKENVPGEHIEDRMAKEAVEWMRSLPKDQPFYMHYWQFSVHGPWQAKQELIDRYIPKVDLITPQNSPTYASMVHSLDEAVGRLLDEVDRAGMADRTAIVFFSDNGGNIHSSVDGTVPTCNAPLRGGKATMYEGGTRVPCVIVWPGVTRAGTRSDAIIQSTDLYPTILGLLNIALPADYVLDGEDFTPTLRGEPWTRNRPIITYFPHSPRVHDWLPPSIAIHDGDWKLIRLFHEGEDGRHRHLLYNLKDDIGEMRDRSADHPDRVAEMDAIIERYIRDANVVVPVRNPDFDPAQYKPESIGVQPGRPPVHPSEVGGRVETVEGVPALAGWTGRGALFEATGAGARVHGQGKNSFITKAGLTLPTPVKVEIEVSAGSGGRGAVQWRTTADEEFRNDAMDSFSVPSERRTVTVNLSAKEGETIQHVRIFLPGGRPPVRLHRIRLVGAGVEDVARFGD